MMALKTHPTGTEGVYEDNHPRVAGVEVEIRKAKRYGDIMGSRGEDRAKKTKEIFFLFLKDTRTDQVRRQYVNRSLATVPEMLASIS